MNKRQRIKTGKLKRKDRDFLYNKSLKITTKKMALSIKEIIDNDIINEIVNDLNSGYLRYKNE